MVIEEMSELTKEICKYKRGKKDKEHMTEEIADVYIMLEQLKGIMEIEPVAVEYYRVNKIERLKNRLEAKNV
jgi:NTP pyrophosphatase (non-canonical NTP hydrolase)